MDRTKKTPFKKVYNFNKEGSNLNIVGKNTKKALFRHVKS